MYEQTVIVGRLGQDPEMRYIPSGDAVTNFSVAVNSRWTGVDGTPAERVTWYKVVCWGKLLDAEKAARSKHKRKKQPSLERRAELRMFASYVNQERDKRRELDRRRMQIARQQTQEQELTQERDRQRQHLEQLRERGQRVPTYAERRDQEEEKRDLLRMYYVALIAEEDLMKQKRERERSGMELER
jgi:single stranded DNA-binding protein